MVLTVRSDNNQRHERSALKLARRLRGFAFGSYGSLAAVFDGDCSAGNRFSISLTVEEGVALVYPDGRVVGISDM